MGDTKTHGRTRNIFAPAAVNLRVFTAMEKQRLLTLIQNLGMGHSYLRFRGQLIEWKLSCTHDEWAELYRLAFLAYPRGYTPSKESQRESTLGQLVLDAATRLPQPVRLADLVVACWRNHPDRFSLAGYPEYPDSNRVISAIVGRRGLVARGDLRRIGPNLFVVNKEANDG